jgi:hypothetical protein
MAVTVTFIVLDMDFPLQRHGEGDAVEDELVMRDVSTGRGEKRRERRRRRRRRRGRRRRGRRRMKRERRRTAGEWTWGMRSGDKRREPYVCNAVVEFAR